MIKYIYLYQVLAPLGTSLLDQFINAKNPLYAKIGEEKLKPYLDEMPTVNHSINLFNVLKLLYDLLRTKCNMNYH